MTYVSKVILSLLYLASCSLEVSSKEIEFTGRLIIEYDLQSQNRTASDVKATIQLRFKTIHPNGVLFYRQGERDDFLQLELLHGTVRFQANFQGKKTFDIYPSKDNFDDNQWHNVSVAISQTSKEIQVHVDSYKQRKLTLGNFQRVTWKTLIYVGGHRHTNQVNFTGCMTNVRYEGSDLLKDYFNTCRDKEFFLVQFRSSQSFVKLTVRNPLQYMETFTASFTFRTFERHGVLMSVDTISPKFHLRFQLRSGSLLVDEGTQDNTTLLRFGSNLNDGEWHRVYVSLNKSHESLDVLIDGKWKEQKHYSSPNAFTGTSQLNISLGKHGEQQGFVGCMNDLQVNNHRFDFKEMNSYGTKLGKCKLHNPCFRPNPCNGHGHCSPDGKQATCTCDTSSEGPNCKESIYKTTCNMYMEQGLRTDALCNLGTRTSLHTAQCEIRANHSMYTIIVRNKGTKKFKVGAEDDSYLKPDDFYVHKIDYVSEIEQIKGLTRDSEYCSQMLIFESLCDNSTHSYPTPLAYWKLNDDTSQKNDPQDVLSYCHNLNGQRCTTCTFTLTNKAKLPVKSLLFHRRYSAGFSYAVHPLECRGRSENPGEKIVVKDDERLGRVCENNAKPTSLPTIRTSEKPVSYTPSRHGGCRESDASTNGHCGNYSSTMTDPSRSRSPNLVTGRDQGEVLSGKQTDVSADNGLSTALTGLLSCSLVVALLLAVKFGLPRCIVCIRAHNMKGEYIISSGEGTRLGRNTFVGRRGGRCVHDLNGKHGEKGTPAEKHSYWV